MAQKPLTGHRKGKDCKLKAGMTLFGSVIEPIKSPKEVEIPEDVKTAALQGRLTFFIGNGVSRLYGLPSWDELANKMLYLLAKREVIDHDTAALLLNKSTKTKISIADHYFKQNIETKKHPDLSYSSVLLEGITDEKKRGNPIYPLLAKCRVKFITTNYDLFLAEALEGQKLDGEPIKS